MNYKYSEYNICVTDDKVYLVFNTLTQSLLELDRNEFSYFKNKKQTYLSNLTDEELKMLNELGFILHVDCSEIDILKDYYWYNKYNDETLNISILTTLNCNFKCPYCFETHRNVKLTQNIQDAILHFIDDKLDGKKVLHVDWYGGEPLLNKETIFSMSKKLEKMCLNKKVLYYATITSNGFLLTEKTAKELSDVGVRAAQITIDSNREAHNTTRILLNGNPTYDVILSSIKSASKYMKIFIRSNVSVETMDKMDGLLSDLKGIPNIKLSIKGIVPASYKKYDKKILSPREFSNKVIDEYIKAESLDIDTALDTFLSNDFHRFCIVDSESQFIFSPDGNIVKCGESYTEDDKGIIGKYNHKNGMMEIDETKKVFWDKDPFLYEECRNCNVLPLCYGGCQMKRKIKNEEACSPELKYNINKLVLHLYYNNYYGD